jgi:Bacterial regulatory proteins, tetR family
VAAIVWGDGLQVCSDDAVDGLSSAPLVPGFARNGRATARVPATRSRATRETCHLDNKFFRYTLDMTAEHRTQQERRSKAETALLNAAAELVVEEGVHSLTLARVGQRAAYSRGLITHYFGSKQALLERLARVTQSGFVPGLDGAPPGLERLLDLIDGYRVVR